MDRDALSREGFNTTTTPLSGGETYTGKWELSEGHPQVGISCKTDADGTLFFEFSNDGVYADSVFPVNGFGISASINEFHTAVKLGRYFRIRIVNGSSAQTYLRCYTYYGQFGLSNTPLNQAIGLDSDAILTRSTVPQDEIRIGRRNGVTGWTKFGLRDGLTASSGDQTVWDTTGDFTPQSSAETYTVAYNNSTDGEGTTGCLSVSVNYIDSNGKTAIAVHTLGDTGSDTTTFSGFGINRVALLSHGGVTSKTNVNDITFTTTSSSLKQAVVPAGKGVTNQAIYISPANHDSVMKTLFINIGKGGGGGNPKVRIKAFVYNRDTTNGIYEIFNAIFNTNTEQSLVYNEDIGFTLAPTDVIWFTADTDTNSAQASVRFSLNDYERT